MIRDLYFYPLAALLIAGMVAFALSFGSTQDLSREDIIRAGWRMEGAALQNLSASPGTNMRYIDEDGGYVRLSAFTPFDVGPASLGVFATLGPDHEDAFAGRTLRITFRARASDTDPLDAFQSAYVPVEAPASGWTTFALTRDWQEYSYGFTPKQVAAPANADLIGVFPGVRGEQEEMDLASIRVSVIDADEAP